MIGLTSKDYVLALKMEESMAGVLVACSPACAIIFCIITSFWTNYSFRHPFLLTNFCIMLGNIVYLIAFDLDSAFLLFFGRFCIGIGGARVINRRYIVDTVSVKQRTRISTIFVASGALGMALGPLMGGGLSSI
jgi:MFS family permease